MWSYYGRKTKVIKYYPSPLYDTIIEPFGGTATYSLYKNNWERSVIILDKYDVIFKLWNYLKYATPEDILRLPVPQNGQLLETMPEWNYLRKEEKYLIGFCSNAGSATPKHTAGKLDTNFNRWFKDKIRISRELYKIRHWQFLVGDYTDLPNIEATWFIDPPYQLRGKWYKHHDIDYTQLASWCQERKGQVIVCENLGADWLPFKILKENNGQLRKTTEVIWYKENN